MHKRLSLFLALLIFAETVSFAGLGSKKAAYVGGTVPVFKDVKNPVEGILDTTDETELRFKHGKNKEEIVSIPYASVVDLEYGQKAGRRVGAAIATAILISPVGLFLLFSKKRKHFLTIGYKDQEGKDQVAVFELGKDIVRTTLAVVETRSGKKMTYQDKEAEKAGRGGD